MLYTLFSYFHINFFHYITVRATIGFVLSFLLTLLIMPYFIRWARAKKANQPISQWAPERHKGKKDTPTMGGFVFIVATIITTLICADLSNPFIIAGLLIIVTFLAIGMSDDLGKIIKKENSAGLKPSSKLKWQVSGGLVISTFLVTYCNMPTDFYLPFYKYPLIDMGLFAILFWTLVIVATSNAVNLTDGLDGLATVPSIFAFISLGGLAYITGNAVLSSYLLLPKIVGVGEIAIIASSLIGALIGFLWFNSNPAEVFMGDSGSLTIGAFMGYCAIITKSEILLLLMGFIFVLETVSVIIQVASFKTRGKKVFLMAPIHHHFELKNWAENKIIVRFWIIALISNIIAFMTLKIR